MSCPGHRIYPIQSMQVEHICQDYVVCSREVSEGAKDFEDNTRWSSSEDAVSLVQLAQEILEILQTHSTPSGKHLEMKIGAETPIIGP